MNVFELFAKLGLDTSDFEAGLNRAMNAGSTLGSGLMSAARIGAQALTAATTAVTAMGAASVKTGAEFDKSMSQVAATMGTTVDQIDNLREFAQEMGRTTAFSATQAADALNYMALAGYDAGTSMEMLPNVLNLAAAGSMDLALASDMLTDTQTAFGISLERTNLLVDEMAKAASTGNTSVTQLGEAFLTVGGLAAELNGGLVTLEDGTEVAVDGVQELEIALTAMANAGIKGSEAGTHMRNMLMKLSSPTSDGVAQLEALGVAVFDAEGNMRSLSDIFGELNVAMGDLTQEEKIQAITDLFNARDIASAEAMLNAVSQDWDAIGESILNADGAAKQMADTQLDNLAGDVTLFKSALEGAQIAISDVLTGGSKDEGLRAFVNFGTEGIQRLTEAFKSGGLTEAMGVFGEVLSDGLNMIVSKLPDFIDAGIQLLGAFGQGIIENLPLLSDTATKIISQLGNTLAENMPVMIQAGSDILKSLLTAISDNLDTVAPIITDAIVGFIQIVADNADKMIEIAITIMGAIGKGIVQAAPIIAEHAPEIIGALTSAIAENPTALIALGPKIIGSISKGIKFALPLIKNVGKLLPAELGTTITTGLSTIGTSISSFFSSMISGIGTFLTSTLGTVLTGIVGSVAAFFAGSEIGKHIGAAIFPDDADLYEGYSGISGTLTMLGDTFVAIKDFILFAWEDVGAFFRGVWDSIANTFANVGEWFNEKFTQAKDFVVSAWQSVVGFYQGIWNGIVSVFNVVADWFRERFETAKNNVVAVWETIVKFYSDIWDGIKKVFEIVGTWFSEKFTEAKENVLNVWSDIKEKFGEIWENIKSAFNISDALTWGKDMIDNFIKGIKAKIDDLVSACKDIAGTVADYLGFSEPEKGPLADFHTFAPDMVDLFTSGIEDGKAQLEDVLSNTFAMPEVDTRANVAYNSSVRPAFADGSSDSMQPINLTIPVYIGQEQIETIVLDAIDSNNFRTGGR